MCPDHRAGPPWPQDDLSGPQGLADQTWGSGGRYGLRAWLAPSGFHGRFKDQNGTPHPPHTHTQILILQQEAGSRNAFTLYYRHTPPWSRQPSHSHGVPTLIS